MKIVIDDLNLSLLDTSFVTKEIANSNNIKLELIYKSIFTNTSTIRNLVSIICNELKLESTMKFKIVLIVDELNNNAIEYWSRDEDINIMRINIEKELDSYSINIEVEDSWKWKYNKKAYEMHEIWEKKLKEGFNNHSSIRWRGLFLIIKNIVDDLYFKDSEKWGLIVWIVKKIKI